MLQDTGWPLCKIVHSVVSTMAVLFIKASHTLTQFQIRLNEIIQSDLNLKKGNNKPANIVKF